MAGRVSITDRRVRAEASIDPQIGGVSTHRQPGLLRLGEPEPKAGPATTTGRPEDLDGSRVRRRRHVARHDSEMAYVALLRGINVGGKAKVDMKQLKATFERLGLENVR